GAARFPPIPIRCFRVPANTCLHSWQGANGTTSNENFERTSPWPWERERFEVLPSPDSSCRYRRYRHNGNRWPLRPRLRREPLKSVAGTGSGVRRISRVRVKEANASERPAADLQNAE